MKLLLILHVCILVTSSSDLSDDVHLHFHFEDFIDDGSAPGSQWKPFQPRVGRGLDTAGLSSKCYCGLATQESQENRIVGGSETVVNEFPWQVRVEYSLPVWEIEVCGGSLISNRWVLTAFHCTMLVGNDGSVETFLLPNQIILYLGEHDIKTKSESNVVKMGISEVVRHHRFGERWFGDYDFALLKMKNNIDFKSSPHIQPICLPKKINKDYSNYKATVSGWGRVEYDDQADTSSVLLKVELKVMTNSECVDKPYIYESPSNDTCPNSQDICITEQVLCANAKGKDACTGDSGGPLITSGSGNGLTRGQNYELIGVVSAGGGCAESWYPGVFARVSQQMPWIINTTANGWKTCPRV